MTASTPPRSGVVLDVLDDDECLRLLAGEPVGRLGFSAAALPVVLPVSYALDGRRAVFASEPGLKLSAARAGSVACLEIDGFDAFAHDGWSVLATGRLAVIDDAEGEARAKALPLSPWAAAGDAHHIALCIELLSGRRIERRAPSPADAATSAVRRPARDLRPSPAGDGFADADGEIETQQGEEP